MTRNDASLVAASASTTKSVKRHLGKEHVEPTSKDSIGDEATVTSKRSFKEQVLEHNSQRKVLRHALYAVVVSLLVMFAVNGFELVSRAEPYFPECSVMKTDGAITSGFSTPLYSEPTPAHVYLSQCADGAITTPASSSQDSDSFSSPLYSEPTPASVHLSLCAERPENYSPQKRSLMSAVSSACSCLTITSTEDVPLTVTVVCRILTYVANVEVLLMLL